MANNPLSAFNQGNFWSEPKQQGRGAPQQGQGAPQQPQPEPEFDYKTSQVNPKGEALPAGAKQWTPMGQPYFGPGIGGTLKRYAWTMMGSPTGQDDSRWTKFLELSQSPQFWNDPTSKEFKAGMGEFGAGVMGKTDTQAQDWNQISEGNARLKQIKDQYGDSTDNMPSEVAAEYKELQSLWNDPTKALNKIDSAASGSLLSPLIRGTKVAVQATLDVLSEAAIKVEQAQGMTSAMRDYAQANSDLPAIASDIDRTQGSPAELEGFWNNPMVALKSESAQEIGNITSRLLLPVLNTWDAFRFFTAPGTKQQKMDAIEGGWNAGRILYSQAIKPSLLEEFKRRAAAGEDPQLLAQELQNPWAEAVGQMILDPLNVVGAFAKGAKAAGMLDDATDAVRGGSLGDEAAELLEAAGKTPLGETTAAGKLDEFDNLLVKKVDDIEANRLTVDFNKATSYSPSGLRVRETKTVQTVSNVATSAIMRNGGGADDVADFFHNIAKAVSPDKARRLEAWDELMTMSNRFGMGRYAFSDDVIETGILLRNLSEDKDLLTVLKAGKGDLAETAKILSRKFEAAVEKQIPTYTQVKNLAEDFRTGKDATKQAAKAADTYKGIKSKALWNLHEGTVGKARQTINSLLGKFYFSQPGFVARNASGNFTTMFIDQGFTGTVKSMYRDGKYWSIGAIEDDLRRWNGGNLPPAVGGDSLASAEKAATGITAFNEKVENAFAKRIYWKQFKDTMDKFMQPGVALPKRQEFKALGMTDEGIDHFVHVLKNEAYGNVEQALARYAEKFGDNGVLEAWKRWNGSVSADEMKGLSDIGITKEIDDIVATAKTPQEIRQRVTKLKQELTNRANSATDNPIGVNRERKGFEFVEGINKAAEQGLMDVDGTNKLNILIEQSERASEELMKAIGKARDTVTDPRLREQFGVMESVFSAERRGAARTVSQQMTETAWDLTKQSRKSTGLGVEALWNKSILAKRGPAPAGLTADQFRQELWQATRGDVSNNWEMYFSEGFDKLTPLIDNLSEQFPDLAPIFAKSQKSSAELNVYRTAIYRDGKIFYQQPPQNIRELASRYGIATATAEGVPQDRQLLATINKYAGQKYKTLDEVPMEEAEKALQARKAGAMTQADAARVEQPKAVGEQAATANVAQAAPANQTPFISAALDDSVTSYPTKNIKIDKGKNLTPAQREVEARLAEKIDNDLEGTIAEYWAARKPQDSNVLNVDFARELSEDYLSDPMNNAAAVQKPASALIRHIWETEIAKPLEGKLETIMFTAGGGGSGKGTAIKNVPIPNSKLVWDMTLSEEKDLRYIEQVINSGRRAEVIHVARDPLDALLGAATRAAEEGRTLPLSVWAEAHTGAPDTFRKGIEKFAGNKKVSLRIVDNTGEFGSAKEVPLDFIKERIYTREELLQQGRAALQKGYEDGSIPENVYRATIGDAPQGAERVPGDIARAGSGSTGASDIRGGIKSQRPEVSGQPQQQLTDELGAIAEPTPNPEIQIQPPYVDGSTPIPGQMWKENSDGVLNALNKVERHMLDNYGMQAIEKLDGSQLKALKGLMKDSGGRITEGMAIADKIGKEWRDFALLPYGETKNFDLALSYAFPYQFWYSRSYSNWMKRVATDPQVIANYARIKETMSEVNKDSPEWWRYNVEIPSHFLGLPNEHPMSFNLEANIWPLYGLTGTDFNDPQKRQNWFTATVDDMGKLGPSTWAPIQWAIALAYKAQGEDELAQAFGGRIIPQTATIKAVSSYFGQPVELDPGVQMFSGKGIMDFDAMDKYERNRVGRALTAMVQSGELTEEQAVEIARTQEGAAWDEAVKRATQIRAPGQISSFFLGVGMKARTEEDRITDEFYEKYYRLQNLNEADLISPEKYQQEWDGLRDQYPFMDALLLSRKAGPDRDRAYAYNVLGRIPPGQASELYKLVGIDSKTAQKFYDSKGNIKEWSEAERERFIAATVDLGAMLAIPEYSTKQDWNAARSGYKAIQAGMEQAFGKGIQDKIDELFSLEDKDARDRFVRSNPIVSQALQWQNEQVVNSPDVYEFYGGLQALEKFHKGKVYDTLEKKFGADIQEKFDKYYDMQIADPAGAKSYYRLHPELKRYNEEKKVLMEQAIRQIVEFGARLPETPLPELTGNEPESVAQQNIQDYATQTTPGFDFWQQKMPEVSAILADYWQNGGKVPYAVTKNLDYQAQQYGFGSGDDLMQAILISMQR